mmetsp:Transcript_104321/g.196352  ORF Transcript_104321/g.196352 Transcript_104321/m.196352 type:complete len:80 (-) Transcript_104321:92-331(-)
MNPEVMQIFELENESRRAVVVTEAVKGMSKVFHAAARRRRGAGEVQPKAPIALPQWCRTALTFKPAVFDCPQQLTDTLI